MDAKKIVDGLFAIPAGQVNTFFLDSPDGGVLIDSGFPESADKVLTALAELGKKPSDIRHIVVTHAHPDHIGSLAALQKATEAETYVHPLDAPIVTSGTGFRRLGESPNVLGKLMIKLLVRPAMHVEPAIVDHLVQDGEVLPIAGGLQVVHVPGHCAGQVALLWPQHGGVLFAADACMHLMGLGLTIGYEDIREGKRSVAKLARLPFAVACFGHGGALLHDADAQFRKKWLQG